MTRANDAAKEMIKIHKPKAIRFVSDKKILLGTYKDKPVFFVQMWHIENQTLDQ